MPRYGFHYDQITIDADYSNLTEARKHALETFGILIHDQADAGPFADASMLVSDANGSPLFTLRLLVEEH
jgi:hypothetical protein